MRKRSKIRELTLGCQSLHTRAVCHSTKHRCCICSQYLLRVSLIYHHFSCSADYWVFRRVSVLFLLLFIFCFSGVEWTWKNLEAKGGMVDKKGDRMFCWYWGFTLWSRKSLMILSGHPIGTVCLILLVSATSVWAILDAPDDRRALHALQTLGSKIEVGIKSQRPAVSCCCLKFYNYFFQLFMNLRVRNQQV